jgi:excisionase family DNA binding protein
VHYFWREDLDQLLGKQPGGTIYSEQRTPLDPNARLSHSQAADYLGVSIETLYRWVKAGKIRSVVPRKRGAGQRYYLPGDLERYLERRTQKELN